MSATIDHPATDPFTPSARQAFQELKRELQERLRRTLPDSSEILGVAQRLCAIRQSGAYLLDLCEPETLVVRGACSATYAVVAVSPPAVSAAPEPPPMSVVAPVAPRPPRARRTASATRAPSATSFWTPRY